MFGYDARLTEVWDTLFPIRYLLTLENSEEKEEAFFESMKLLGLNRNGFHIIRSKKIEGSFMQICNDIYKTHYKAVREANDLYPNTSIAIFEDDCRPVDDCFAAFRLVHAFHHLKSKKDWYVFNLGQTAMGPIFRDGSYRPVVLTSMPLAAHSYILNGKHIPDMLKKYSENKWKAPWAVEIMLTVHPKYKLAVYPNVTQQIVVPRSQKCFPVIRHMTFDQFSSKCNTFMLRCPWIATFVFLIIVFMIASISYLHKRI